MTTEKGKASTPTGRRWRLLGGVLGGVLIIAVGYTAYWAQVLRFHQTTDDAYVNGNVVQIIGPGNPVWPQLSYAHFGVEPQ